VTPDEADAYATYYLHNVAHTLAFGSYFLLWLAVVWGMMLRNGWASTRMRHSTIYHIHMIIALFGLSLGILHAAAQLFVPGGEIRVVDEFIPFLDRNDRIGVGAATIGMELFIAAALAVGFQKKLGFTRFRAVHSMTYGALLLEGGHGLISGSHVRHPLIWGSILLSMVSVIVLWLATTPLPARARREVAERMATRQKAVESVTIRVDPDRCARFDQCQKHAPDVFRACPDGRLAYQASVTVDNLDPVIRAVEACPARAITLGKAPSAISMAHRSFARGAPGHGRTGAANGRAAGVPRTRMSR
jgi:ferredoxin